MTKINPVRTISHYGRIPLGTIATSMIHLPDFFDWHTQEIMEEMAMEYDPCIILDGEGGYWVGFAHEFTTPRWIYCKWEGPAYIAASYEFIDNMIIPHPTPAHEIRVGERVEIAAYEVRLVHQNPATAQVLLISTGMPWFWLRILYHRLAYIAEVVLEHLGFLTYD